MQFPISTAKKDEIACQCYALVDGCCSCCHRDDTPPRPWRNVRSSILRDLQGTELAAAQKLAEKEEAKARKQGGRNKGKAPSGEQNGTGASAAPQGKVAAQCSWLGVSIHNSKHLDHHAGWLDLGRDGP
jgi:hypothetical protein